MNALISACAKYRYWLTRGTGLLCPTKEDLLFVMLNPSIADATIDDPTIRRCMRFAIRYGYKSLTVVNLYALRATNPQELYKTKDPVGPDNNFHLMEMLKQHGEAVCAWGNNAQAARVKEFLSLAEGTKLLCFGINKGGAPKHPLYIKANQTLIKYDTQNRG